MSTVSNPMSVSVGDTPAKRKGRNKSLLGVKLTQITEKLLENEGSGLTEIKRQSIGCTSVI